MIQWELLAPLDEAASREVLQRARRRRFKRNDVLVHEGDPADSLHLLAKGHVAVCKTTPLGDIATLRVLAPGSHFGELALLSEGARSATIVALDAVETLSLHRTDLDELRRDVQGFDEVMVQSLVREVRRLSDLLTEAYYLPAERRVWRRLCELAQIYRDGSDAVTVPITQEQLAHLAGTTRPTTNQVLRTAAERGLVAVSRGSITVLDDAALQRAAR